MIVLNMKVGFNNIITSLSAIRTHVLKNLKYGRKKTQETQNASQVGVNCSDRG